MKESFEVRHPFFRPFWRRALLTGLCLLWALFELSHGAVIWAAIFAACGAYLFVQFFLRFDPNDYQDKEK